MPKNLDPKKRISSFKSKDMKKGPMKKRSMGKSNKKSGRYS